MGILPYSPGAHKADLPAKLVACEVLPGGQFC